MLLLRPWAWFCPKDKKMVRHGGVFWHPVPLNPVFLDKIPPEEEENTVWRIFKCLIFNGLNLRLPLQVDLLPYGIIIRNQHFKPCPNFVAGICWTISTFSLNVLCFI
jgi:hypothetical protein